jgi:peptide/nickel transport system substrate-binding protein
LRLANSFEVTNVGPSAFKHWLTSYGAMQTLYYTNPDLTLRPWVSSSVEPNGQEGWTIRLNPAARFHNGRAIDAAIVRECIERHLASGVSVPSLTGARWELPDSRTLRVMTSEPDPWMRYYLAGANYFPLFDPAEAPPAVDLASLIGKGHFSGPFRVTGLTPQQMTMEAVPDAWDGPAKLAGVDVKFVRDAPARLAALKTGEIDLMMYPPADAVPAIKATSGLHYKATSSTIRVALIFNHTRPPFNEAAVRRAFALGFDRKQLAERVLNGAYEAPDTIFAAASPWSVRGVLRSDPAEARRLLDTAGWRPGPDGIRAQGSRRLSVDLVHYPQQPDGKPLAEAMQAQLKEVGFEVRLRQADDALATYRAKDYDAGLFYMDVQYGGNPMSLLPMLLTDNARNYGGWGSADLDAAVARARTEFDAAKRDEALKQVQTIMARDVPITFTVSQSWATVTNDAFAGYVPTSMVHHFMVTKDTAPVGRR